MIYWVRCQIFPNRQLIQEEKVVYLGCHKFMKKLSNRQNENRTAQQEIQFHRGSMKK